MEEPKLPSITEWLPLRKNKQYKLFVRKDKSVIFQIKNEEGRICIQGDLDFHLEEVDND